MPDNSRAVHAVLSNNNRTVRTVPTKLTHVDSAGKESEYAEAKLETSRVVTRIMFLPNT